MGKTKDLETALARAEQGLGRACDGLRIGLGYARSLEAKQPHKEVSIVVSQERRLNDMTRARAQAREVLGLGQVPCPPHNFLDQDDGGNAICRNCGVDQIVVDPPRDPIT